MRRPDLIPFETRRMYIGGLWCESTSRETLELVNPSDGSVLADIARGGPADVDAAVSAARGALEGDWGRLSAAERGRYLAAMGQRVLEQADELARLEALDVGKPLRQGRADAVALARYLEFYAGAADTRTLRLSFVTASLEDIERGIAALATVIREQQT